MNALANLPCELGVASSAVLGVMVGFLICITFVLFPLWRKGTHVFICLNTILTPMVLSENIIIPNFAQDININTFSLGYLFKWYRPNFAINGCVGCYNTYRKICERINVREIRHIGDAIHFCPNPSIDCRSFAGVFEIDSKSYGGVVCLTNHSIRQQPRSLVSYPRIPHLPKRENDGYEGEYLQPILNYTKETTLLLLAFVSMWWSHRRRNTLTEIAAFFIGAIFFGWWFLIVTDGMYLITHN